MCSQECDKYVKITYAAAKKAAGIGVPTTDGGVGDTPAMKEGNYADDKDLIVVARPFIEHAMLSAVLAVSGSDTGATCFGPSDMQLSANTSVKTIEGMHCKY